MRYLAFYASILAMLTGCTRPAPLDNPDTLVGFHITASPYGEGIELSIKGAHSIRFIQPQPARGAGWVGAAKVGMGAARDAVIGYSVSEALSKIGTADRTVVINEP